MSVGADDGSAVGLLHFQLDFRSIDVLKDFAEELGVEADFDGVACEGTYDAFLSLFAVVDILTGNACAVGCQGNADLVGGLVGIDADTTDGLQEGVAGNDEALVIVFRYNNLIIRIVSLFK